LPTPPAPSETLAHELFADLGSIRTKRMFSGTGVYANDLFFALIVGEVLYIKADDETEAAFHDAGCARFTYDSARGVRTIRYFRLPDAALDDPDEALHWGRLGVAAAARAKAGSGRKKAAGKRAPRLLIDGPWDEG